jgi:hypothetical protein
LDEINGCDAFSAKKIFPPTNYTEKEEIKIRLIVQFLILCPLIVIITIKHHL